MEFRALEAVFRAHLEDREGAADRMKALLVDYQKILVKNVDVRLLVNWTIEYLALQGCIWFVHDPF